MFGIAEPTIAAGVVAENGRCMLITNVLLIFSAEFLVSAALLVNVNLIWLSPNKPIHSAHTSKTQSAFLN